MSSRLNLKTRKSINKPSRTQSFGSVKDSRCKNRMVWKWLWTTTCKESEATLLTFLAFLIWLAFIHPWINPQMPASGLTLPLRSTPCQSMLTTVHLSLTSNRKGFWMHSTLSRICLFEQSHMFWDTKISHISRHFVRRRCIILSKLKKNTEFYNRNSSFQRAIN